MPYNGPQSEFALGGFEGDPENACRAWCEAMAEQSRRRDFGPEAFIVAGLNRCRACFSSITDPDLAARTAVWICAACSVFTPGSSDCDRWEAEAFKALDRGAAPALCLAIGVIAAARRVWHGIPVGRLAEHRLRLDASILSTGDHRASDAWIAARMHCDLVHETPIRLAAITPTVAEAMERVDLHGDSHAMPLRAAEFVRHLTTGKLDEARAYLHRTTSLLHQLAPYDAWVFFLYKAAFGLAARDADAALMDASRAVAYASQCRVPHAEFWAKLAVARAASMAAQARGVWRRLAEARRVARTLHLDGLLALCRLASALVALERRRAAKAAVLARSALAYMEQTQMLRPLLFASADFECLLQCVDADGAPAIAIPHLRLTHTTVHSAVSPSKAARTAKVEIRCLGRFSVVRTGSRLVWSRKAPRRPLDLLKLTIAPGSGGASVAQLVDALWPGMDGDRAQAAFRTALYRLRGLLGECTLTLSAGRLELNRDHAWVDVFEFEEAARGGNACIDGRAVLALYSGAFLPDEAELPWATAARDRLREQFRSAVRRSAEQLLASGRWHDAIDLLDPALERDPLAEVFYQRAIAACLAGGLRAEASGYYERCRGALSQHLGVAPSHKTEVLYRDVLRCARS